MDEVRGRQIIASLEGDPFFTDWLDPSRLFDRRDIEAAIATVLEQANGDLPPLPGAKERAMVRLAIFQVVAPHLDDGPGSWIDLMERLSPDELSAIEDLLGKMTLGELLE